MYICIYVCVYIYNCLPQLRIATSEKFLVVNAIKQKTKAHHGTPHV